MQTSQYVPWFADRHRTARLVHRRIAGGTDQLPDPFSALMPYYEQFDRACLLREVDQAAAVHGDRLHVEVGVPFPPLTQAAVKPGPRQPVSSGDGVVRVNIGVPRLPRGQHAHRQTAKSRLVQCAQQYAVQCREFIQFRDDPALACPVRIEPMDDSKWTMRAVANAAAVEPIRPWLLCFRPMEPTHRSAAQRDDSINARVAFFCRISISILTGLSVDSTAVYACLTAISAVANSRAASSGSAFGWSLGSMADTKPQRDISTDGLIDCPKGRANRGSRPVDSDHDYGGRWVVIVHLAPASRGC
jgi:hypothetical protein